MHIHPLHLLQNPLPPSAIPISALQFSSFHLQPSSFMPLALLTSPAPPPAYLQHDEPSHPENASRLRAIHAMLEKTGLRERCLNLDPKPATIEQITAVHTEEYVTQLERVMARAPGYLDPDTHIVPQSDATSVLAAGGAIRAVDAGIDEPT